MYPFSIGVMLDSCRTDEKTALDKAQALGAKGIQVYATPRRYVSFGHDSGA